MPFPYPKRPGGRRRRARLARGLVATLAATTLVVSGCTVAGGDGRFTLSHGMSLTEDEFRYGVAPEPHPDTTYADDVVIVGGGASSVRSVSGDGLFWTIDADAPGADQLAVGKVFFITNRGVGRVLHLERDGNDLTVIIGPVEITEVITDGDFGAEEVELQLEDMIFQETGELPWTLTPIAPTTDPDAEAESDHGNGADTGGQGGEQAGSVPGQGTGATAVLPAALAQPASPDPDDEGEPVAEYGRPDPPPRPTWGGAGWTDAGPGARYQVKPLCCVGAEIGYQQQGVTLKALISLYGELPRVSWRLRIANATIQEASVHITGAAGFRYSVDLRTGPDYQGHNIVDMINVPVPIEVPLPAVGGISFSLKMDQWFQVRIGASAKNSWLTGSGHWSFEGGIGFGYRNGAWGAHTTGSPRTGQSILQSVQGDSLAVQSIGLAHQARLMVGIGWFGFSVGPYAKVTTSLGLTRSSGMEGGFTAGLNRTQGGLNMWLAFGIGYSIPKVVATIINFFLRAVGARTIQVQGSIAEHNVGILNTTGEHNSR